MGHKNAGNFIPGNRGFGTKVAFLENLSVSFSKELENINVLSQRYLFFDMTH